MRMGKGKAKDSELAAKVMGGQNAHQLEVWELIAALNSMKKIKQKKESPESMNSEDRNSEDRRTLGLY